MQVEKQEPSFIGPAAWASASISAFIVFLIWTFTLFVPALALNFLVVLFLTAPLLVLSNSVFFWIPVLVCTVCFYIAFIRNLVGKQRPSVWWAVGVQFLAIVILLLPYRMEVLQRLAS
ncbi:MAG: hypothetical protein AAFV37_13595 [Pseudomonadota bacterium]